MVTLAFVMTACTDEEPEPYVADTVAEVPAEDEDTELTELVIEDLEVGTGSEVEEGDTVLIDWTGYYLDDEGTVGMLFNSSAMQGGPYEFIVGNSDVIEGWHAGVLGMQAGGVRVLKVPANMAFGAEGVHSMVEPDQDLKFEITLLEIRYALEQ